MFPDQNPEPSRHCVAITAGAGQSGAELRFALAAIIITLGFLWTSWLFIGVYIGWR